MKRTSMYRFLIVVVLAIFLGIGIEFLQKYCTPKRIFDWYDIVANSLGAISSFFLVKNYFAVQNKNISL